MQKSNHIYIHFVASDHLEAQQALDALILQYGQSELEHANVIVALGGDGFLLRTLHQSLSLKLPVYGINFGSVGFLMNQNRFNQDSPENLYDVIERAKTYQLFPLKMIAKNDRGESFEFLAINEVSLLRQRHQAAKIKIEIDGVTRLEELICDGIIVSTPTGSTAYNLSVHGPILPLSSNLLALTPISAFRPRRWRGALLPNNSCVRFEISEPDKRPVSVSADDQEVRHITEVTISQDNEHAYTLLFDPEHGWEERIIREQFLV